MMLLLSLTVLDPLHCWVWLCLTNGWLLFHLTGNSFIFLPIPFYRVIQKKSKSYSRAEKWELLSLSKEPVKVSYPQKRHSGNQEWFHPSFAITERSWATLFSQAAGRHRTAALLSQTQLHLDHYSYAGQVQKADSCKNDLNQGKGTVRQL